MTPNLEKTFCKQKKQMKTSWKSTISKNQKIQINGLHNVENLTKYTSSVGSLRKTSLMELHLMTNGVSG